MQSTKLFFENGSGASLAAYLDLPIDGEPIAYALFAHCFTCSKNLHAVANISASLTLRGIAVLRFDFTGLGESEGDFAATNFSTNVDDLVAAARYMADHGQAPALLIGHSLGGAAILQAASRIPSAVAVATIAAPSEPSHILKLLGGSAEQIREAGQADVNLAGRTFTIRRQFVDDLEARRMHDTVRHLDRALLVLHSPIDQIVGIENAAQIFEAAVHPKSFISLDEADHLLSNDDDSCYVGAMIASWATKYLSRAAAVPSSEAGGGRIVVRNEVGSLRATVKAGRHGLLVDEPKEVGGTDMGPTPYDLLCASLGACTALTLRLYADRKQWDLGSVVVRLRHRKVHLEDCVSCESENTKLDHIDREIELNGRLDEAQRDRLMQIANLCPVHKTLHDGFQINTVRRN